MSTDFKELDPDSPEYDAAMEAAQAAEDAEREGKSEEETTPEDPPKEEPKAEPTETTTTTEAEAAAAVAKEEPKADEPKVAGVASKDGKVVLPYSALQAERRTAKRERYAKEQAEKERDAAKQELADFMAGKKSGISAERLQELEADEPEVAAEIKSLREKNEQLAAKVPKAPEPDDEDDPAEEAMYLVPELAKWAQSDPDKFKRAVDHDNVLRTSPKWKDMEGTVENFAKRYRAAIKLVADEYDLKLEDAPQAPTPPPPPAAKRDPKEAIDKAERATPQSLSDFKGGSVDQTQGRIERMPARQMLSRFEDMTDAEIEAHLAKTGGG